MYESSDVAQCLLTWAEHAAARIVEQQLTIDNLKEVIEEMKKLMEQK